MKILVTICARGGSKGIPQKNIKSLNGRPLIDYSIQCAKKIKERYMNVVIELSTDDEEIKDVAKRSGLFSNYIRPANLASDTAGKVDAIRDILGYAEEVYASNFDYVLDLDVSSPLRTLKDIENAFAIIEKKDEALTLFSVNKAHKNPYFNMVEVNKTGFYQISKNATTTTLARQSAPEVYELNASFYIYRRTFFDSAWKGVITDKSMIYEMDHICFDLDTPIDFEFMDFLLSRRKLEFDLI